MRKLEVLFFDVLGTVVDWRGSITREATEFFSKHDATHVEASAFADAWVGRYDASVEDVRSGDRSFVTLDVLNMENLKATLRQFGLAPSAVAQAELDKLNFIWHRLEPWPDAVPAISHLKNKYIVAPLSDGNTRLMVNMAKYSGLPWDTVFGADVYCTYKPMPQVYLGACKLLDVLPENAMLIAAHTYDLNAAQKLGLRTAYVARRNESDPPIPSSDRISKNWDFEADGLLEIATHLGKI